MRLRSASVAPHWRLLEEKIDSRSLQIPLKHYYSASAWLCAIKSNNTRGYFWLGDESKWKWSGKDRWIIHEHKTGPEQKTKLDHLPFPPPPGCCCCRCTSQAGMQVCDFSIIGPVVVLLTAPVGEQLPLTSSPSSPVLLSSFPILFLPNFLHSYKTIIITSTPPRAVRRESPSFTSCMGNGSWSVIITF